MNDRLDVVATQGDEPSRHKPVHILHALDMASGRHDLDESVGSFDPPGATALKIGRAT
jgi:hypothetical protein